MASLVWYKDEEGGYLYSPELSTELRTAVQPLQRFRAFCELEPAKGLHAGNKWHWDVIHDVATMGTKLEETQPIPETNFKITQNTLTITEYGNSVPFTAKLQNLAKAPVQRIVRTALAHDARKRFEIEAFNEFKKTPLRVVPTGGNSATSVTLTTDGVPAAANDSPLTKEHVKAIVDEMKERNIPPHVQDDYFAVSHVTTFRPFYNELESIHQYTDSGFQRLIRGEMGRYNNCRFFEQNQIPKGGAADSTTFKPETMTADPWNNGKSSWAVIFGADTVMEAPVIPEEIRGRVSSDFGRLHAIAWYAMTGFGIVHTDPTQARIVMWDSAA